MAMLLLLAVVVAMVAEEEEAEVIVLGGGAWLPLLLPGIAPCPGPGPGPCTWLPGWLWRASLLLFGVCG